MAYNLLNDIDDTLRQERLAELWKEWRTPLFVGVIVALVTLVGVELWRNYTADVRANAATAYWQATQAGAEAESQFAAVAESGDGTYRSMARLQLSGMKPTESVKYLEAVADDRGAPGYLRDLATLQLGQRLMDTDAARAQSLLEDLAEAEGPFSLLAREMLAIQAENRGDKEAAKVQYNVIMQKAVLGGEFTMRARHRLEALSQ